MHSIPNEEIPKATVAVIGNPCQKYSNANRRTNYSKDKNFIERPNDPFLDRFISYVKYAEPLVFIIENVRNIVSVGSGVVIDYIKNTLSEYHVEVEVLKTENYGVAQERRRAIIIGSKIGKIKHPEPTTLTPLTVKDVLNNLTDQVPNQKDKRKHNERTLLQVSYVEQGKNVYSIPQEIRPKGIMQNCYYRLKEDSPSITITHAAKAMILHPTEDRCLSIREGARIQSFPDDFVFHGGLNAKYQQVANAVPPKMAREIAKVVKVKINEYLNDLT